MKTIPYKELKEEASQGPFEVDDRALYNQDGLVATIEDPLGCGMELDYAEENAQLIAHTLNHFDALLEALEKIADPNAPVPNDGRSIERYYEDIAMEALKDAQTVKVTI